MRPNIRGWTVAFMGALALTAPAAAQEAAKPAAESYASDVEYEGWKQYHMYCDRCHGQDAGGSTFAPDLRRSVAPNGTLTKETFRATVRDGRVEKGMPAFAPMLTEAQIDAIYAYVKARSEGRLGPGRPKRAT
jgi:mono/diheme cytochrome c family protein